MGSLFNKHSSGVIPSGRWGATEASKHFLKKIADFLVVTHKTWAESIFLHIRGPHNTFGRAEPWGRCREVHGAMAPPKFWLGVQCICPPIIGLHIC